MKVGFHAPLPPARSGVADYAAALLEALRPHAETLVNPIAPCDAELYHLGNNQLHRGIYRRALERPGVVVLHDAVLQHFFLGALTAEAYVEEFVHNYGEWSREQAMAMWRGRSRSGQAPDYFRYPMLRRVAEIARAVVVHNPAAAAMVRAHAPDARVVEIPHLYQPPAASPADKAGEWRRARGLRSETVLFGVFGYLRESKRLSTVARAFRTLRGAGTDVRLLVAGAITTEEVGRAMERAVEAPGVLREGYLPEDRFRLCAAATDVCINLRHPAAGETSGIAIRMMGIGKPVILTAGAETSSIPEDCCVRIDAGAAEAEMLAAYMGWLAESRAARREIGRRAAGYIAREHSLPRCAELYLRVLRQAAAAAPAKAGGRRPSGQTVRRG